MGILDFILDANNYEFRKVGRDEINGLIISTCYTTDEGYETAIIDKNGTHPVERYKTKEDAVGGHAKWILNASDLHKVIMLGWQNELIPDTEIILEPKKDK